MIAHTAYLNVLVAIVTISSLILGGIVVVGKLLWNLSAKWTKTNEEFSRTNDKINDLSDEIRDLVLRKEQDHHRIEDENQSLKRRLERHEMWHAKRDKGKS